MPISAAASIFSVAGTKFAPPLNDNTGDPNMERSKYFTAAIGSTVGGLVLLALGCIFCCGGCLPGGVQPQPQSREKSVDPIIVEDLEPADRTTP